MSTDALALEPFADQLAGEQPLAVTQPELAHVDRAAAQPRAVGTDLADAPDPDEHAPALHRDDEPVDPRGLGAEIDDGVDDPSDLGAVGTEERQSRQP